MFCYTQKALKPSLLLASVPSPLRAAVYQHALLRESLGRSAGALCESKIARNPPPQSLGRRTHAGCGRANTCPRARPTAASAARRQEMATEFGWAQAKTKGVSGKLSNFYTQCSRNAPLPPERSRSPCFWKESGSM